MNKVKVLFFATLRDRAGMRQTELDLSEGATVADLKAHLVERYPTLAESMPTVLVAVDHEYAFDDAVISEGAEVALFPPVSGG